MKSLEQFQAFYQAELRPDLEQLEEKRKQIVGRLTTAGLIAVVVTLALIGGALALLPNPAMGFLAMMLGGAIFYMVYKQMTKGFVAEFKQSIIRRVVQFVDPGLNYYKERCISKAAYLASRIFLIKPDLYFGEDLVAGQIGKTAIQFSEVHSKYKTETRDSKGRTQTQWHTIFQGIFFIADFNKHFQGETVVLPDTAEKLFGRLGQTLQSLNLSRRDQLVRLEDVEFEQRFVVYSDDQIEARYILSPSLMQRMVEFRNRTGHDVYISFVNANIHVAIPTSKNLFEPKVFSSLLKEDLAREYLEDVQLAVGIVEDMNLNTRIWTKQ